MKIVYKNQEDIVVIVHPTIEALQFLTIEEIALKDVPTGLAFAIVEDDSIPSDRTFRDAWTIDNSLLTDRVGA